VSDSGISESIIEQAALIWLERLGWTITHGPDIAPGEPAAERADYGQVVMEQRLQRALAQLNSMLPAEAMAAAFRKLIRPEGSMLKDRNHAVHCLLVDGVTVEHRGADGAICGAQAQVLGEPLLNTIARELTESIRRNVSLDWTLRETVRAQMRMRIWRILCTYGYPADQQAQATRTVLEQAELLSQAWAAA
jgi:type I restriction enzyme R subunit